MFSEFNIEKFRGIKDLKLTNLSRINVLAGINNSGKTSVLEALNLMSDPLNKDKLKELSLMRMNYNLSAYTTVSLSSLFACENDKYNIDISAKFSDKLYSYHATGKNEEIINGEGAFESRFNVSASIFMNEKIVHTYKYNAKDCMNMEDAKTAIKRNKDELVFACNISPYIDWYKTTSGLLNTLILSFNKQEFLSLISTFDSKICDITIINNNIYLHEQNGTVLPLYAYGLGLQKAVMLATTLLRVKGGLILVDEIDNALNVSAFYSVFSWFVKACRERDVQAFVTTHSLEAIDAILEATEDDAKNGLEDDVRIITLGKTPKTHRTVARSLTGDEARSNRERCEMELRI